MIGADDMRSMFLSYRQRGMTWTAIAKRLNNLGLMTSRGNRWTESNVRNHATRNLGICLSGNPRKGCPDCGALSVLVRGVCGPCQYKRREASRTKGGEARRLAGHCGIAGAALMVGVNTATYRQWAEGEPVPDKWAAIVASECARFDAAARLRAEGHIVPLYQDRPITAEQFTHRDR